FLSLNDMNVNFLNIKGQAKLSLKIEALKIGMALISLLFTIPYGLKEVIVGQVIVRVICYILVLFITQKVIGYSVKEQVRDVYAYALLSLGMGGVMLLPKLFFNNFIVLLFVQSAVGIVFYLGIAKIFKSKELEELLMVLRNKLRKNNG